jgi:hypothetical protein
MEPEPGIRRFEALLRGVDDYGGMDDDLRWRELDSADRLRLAALEA